MDLALIEMPQTDAREAFLEYRRAVRDRHDAEDEQIMRGYRELARGRQLISMPETIRAGGFEARRVGGRGRMPGTVFLPRLALCRADARWCHTDGIDSDGAVRFAADAEARFTDRRAWRKHRFMPDGTFDPEQVSPEDGHNRAWGDWRAMVPKVPPALRPTTAMRSFHILWEAEWSRVPPTDPALLKHIGGDLYAVLAIWDLTELERAVLGGRSR